MKHTAPETPSVQSLERGLIILETVAKANAPVSIAHLRTLLGINRSSVFRLANTLRRRGFLTNPKGRTEYIVGPSVWRLFRLNDWSLLVSFCRSHLRALANRTGETAHLAVRQGKQTLFVDHQSSSNQIIAVNGQTGATKPLHCTAHGKALLVDFGPRELKELFGAENFETYTPNTIGTVEQLAGACAAIRGEGFAVDDSEFEEEVRCIAAPIRDGDGCVIASIGISAPSARLPQKRLMEAAGHVRAAALEIEGEWS